MWGDILQSIGNFVTGHGLQNNQSRANEDARNVTRTTTTTVGVRRQVSTPKSFDAPLFEAFQPTQPLTAPAPPQAQQPLLFPKPNTLPTVNDNIYKGHDIGSLNDENRVQARRVIDSARPGTDLKPYLTSAKSYQDLKAKSDYENSVPGKILNTGGQVLRTLGGGALDFINFLTRVPQTIETGLNVAKVNTIDNLPGMEEQKRRDIAQGLLKSKQYDLMQKGLGDVTNFVSGGDTQTNTETNREAQAISTGKGTPGDIFSAIVKSLTAATVVPVGKMLGSLRPAAKDLSLVGKEVTGNVAEDSASILRPSAKTLEKPPVATRPTVVDAAGKLKPAVVENGSIPAKPQVVQSLDRGGSISAPIRAENASLAKASTPEVVAPEMKIAESQAIKDIQDAKVAPAPEAPVVDTAIPQSPIEKASQEVVDNPTVPVDATGKLIHDPAESELGKVAQSYVESGSPQTSEGWAQIASTIEQKANESAQALGTTFEKIVAQVQKTARTKGGTLEGSGLSPAEQSLFSKTVDEMNYVRTRAEINDTKMGSYGKVYYPQQEVGTKYNPKEGLVNENRRGNVLNLKELDNSTSPLGQYVTRYSDASKAIVDNLVNSVERITAADGSVIETGLRIPSAIKREVKNAADELITSRDSVASIKNARIPDFKKAQADISSKADTITQKVLTWLREQPKTPEQQRVLEQLSKERGSYVHSFVESNMLLQVAGRAADAIQKVVFSTVAQVDRLTTGIISKMAARRGVSFAPKTGEGRAVTRQFSRGTTIREVVGNFRTNKATLMSTTGNPASKYLGLQRSLSTAVTQANDLGTFNARKAIGMLVRDAEDAGITGKQEITNYVAKNMLTPKFKDYQKAVDYATNGYIGLPLKPAALGDSKLLHSSIGDKFEQLAGKIDQWGEVVVNHTPGLQEASLAVRQNVARAISRNTTGFLRVSTSVGRRGVDAALGGMPSITRGIKLLNSTTDVEKRVGALLLQRGIADAVAGGGAYALGAFLGVNGQYTGDYPKDAKERARWEAEGIQANSFKFGNIYIQPGRVLGAFALPVVLAANVTSGKGSVEGVIQGTLGQLAENFGVTSLGDMMQSAGEVISGGSSTLKGLSDLLTRWGAQTISSFIPLSGASNQAASLTDPVQRDKNSSNPLTEAMNGITAKFPGLRETLPVKTDTFGQPLKNTNVGLSSWLTVGTSPDSPLYSELNRLSTQDIEAFPKNSLSTIKGTDGENISLTDEQKADLTKTVQQQKQHQAELLIASPEYKSADDKAKSTMLSSVYSLDSGGTVNQWAAKNNIADVKTNGDTINDQLSDEEQRALVTYSALAPDKRDVWLEDNTNALNYYGSTYNNKKANGTLTSKDQDINKTGSLAQKVVIADVNKKKNITQGVINAYADTSKTEFNALEDGSEGKKTLMAYDQALVAAGLPSKYQNKYGGYGSGGSGRNAYAGLSFAKPITARGTVGIKSEKLAIATDPFAGLVKTAPTTQTNLKRNISVNKGVHL